MASAVDGNVASSSTPSTSEFDQAEVDKLIANGKRLYATKDLQGACDIFGDVCSKLAEKYGQTADECGDAYLLYGKTLLDIARSESDVLGSSVSKEMSTSQLKPSHAESKEDGYEEKHASGDSNGTEENGAGEKMDEEKAEEEKIEEEEMEEEKENEKSESGNEDKGSEAEEKDIATEDEQDGKVDGGETSENTGNESGANAEGDDEVEEDGEEDGEGDGEEDGEQDGEQDGEEDGAAEEEVTTMQQAWEILELSRIVFARNETKEHKLKQAEANLLLGEIGMEQEHYPEAVGDFMECLRIQERYLDPSDRLLAVTFYNLGLAYSFDRHYGKAIEYFNKAIDVIKLRIESLTKEVNESTKSSELNDLQELLPELLAKVEDAEYMKKSTEEIIKSAANMARESLESSSFDEPTMDTGKEGETEKKVTNITHLVRKKRKTDEEEDGTVCKKSKEADSSSEV